MAISESMPDSWRVYTVKVVARVVDPEGLNHSYTVQGLELHNPARTIYSETVVPFRRLFPPPIKIEALGLGETGVLECDATGTCRFHPHTPERPLFQIDCPDDGGGGGGNGGGGGPQPGDLSQPPTTGEPIAIAGGPGV